MLGNYVNTLAIIVASIIGLLIRKGLKEEYKTIVMQAIGLSVIFIGAVTALGGLLDPASEPILFIISLVIGGAIGELLRLDRALNKLGMLLQEKVGSNNGSNVARGFVTASLIFCVGTMSILGSIESGLRGNYNMLFAKSVLDGVTSMILSSTLGAGVIFSAAAVFIYQGLIILFAGSIESLLTAQIVREITIIGGILIFGIGLNLLEIKKINTINLLPAIFVPVVYYLLVIPLYQTLFG
ncbi:MAG: DUF554 domain-containing protein [Bacillota bacterium]|nr:DUF554 domain-containing protein [Bacillota bacterium]